MSTFPGLAIAIAVVVIAVNGLHDTLDPRLRTR
jgi:hypothetical protein